MLIFAIFSLVVGVAAILVAFREVREGRMGALSHLLFFGGVFASGGGFMLLVGVLSHQGAS